jgi:hypothetical protein
VPLADDQKIELALLHDIGNPTRVAITQEGELVSSVELIFMDLATIRSATDDFSDSNKIGKGGFNWHCLQGNTISFVFLCSLIITWS